MVRYMSNGVYNTFTHGVCIRIVYGQIYSWWQPSSCPTCTISVANSACACMSAPDTAVLSAPHHPRVFLHFLTLRSHFPSKPGVYSGKISQKGVSHTDPSAAWIRISGRANCNRRQKREGLAALVLVLVHVLVLRKQ
jgi:hypothetical protein